MGIINTSNATKIVGILKQEKARREGGKKNIESSKEETAEATTQIKEIDTLHSDRLDIERDKLESLYLERRYYTGDWPIVYSDVEVCKFPYYQGITDSQCNPYYRISSILSGSIGIDPIDSPVTRANGADGTIDGINRVRSFASTESSFRGPALSAINTFIAETTLNGNTTNNAPGEPLPGNWPSAAAPVPGFCTPTASPDTEAQCTIEGGVWTPPGTASDPVWTPSATATGKLRPVLLAWRDNLIAIRDLVFIADSATIAYYQGIIDDCDTVLTAIATDSVLVRNTGVASGAAWGQTQPLTGADLTALDNLQIEADTGVTDFVSVRDAELQIISEESEKLFFGIVKLRLHNVNGSFSKFSALKQQAAGVTSILKDHEESVQLLTKLVTEYL